jgi:hypothetical protein
VECEEYEEPEEHRRLEKDIGISAIFRLILTTCMFLVFSYSFGQYHLIPKSCYTDTRVYDHSEPNR